MHVAASICALDLGCHALRNEPSKKLFEDNNREKRHCESTAGSAEEGNTQTPIAASKSIESWEGAEDGSSICSL
jgi:hypothetical protein